MSLDKNLKTGSNFIMSAGTTSSYLSNILYESAGKPDKGTWFLETGAKKAKSN